MGTCRPSGGSACTARPPAAREARPPRAAATPGGRASVPHAGLSCPRTFSRGPWAARVLNNQPVFPRRAAGARARPGPARPSEPRSRRHRPPPGALPLAPGAGVQAPQGSQVRTGPRSRLGLQRSHPNPAGGLGCEGLSDAGHHPPQDHEQKGVWGVTHSHPRCRARPAKMQAHSQPRGTHALRLPGSSTHHATPKVPSRPLLTSLHTPTPRRALRPPLPSPQIVSRTLQALTHREGLQGLQTRGLLRPP